MWAQIHYGTFRRENPKAPTLSETLDGYADPERARELFHCLEQVRLEACVRRAFPGLARQMDRIRPPADADRAKALELASSLLDPAATVRDTLDLLDKLYDDPPKLSPLPPWAGQIDIARAEKISQARAGQEIEQLAKAISQLLASPADANDAAEEITLEKITGDSVRQEGSLSSLPLVAGEARKN